MNQEEWDEYLYEPPDDDHDEDYEADREATRYESQLPTWISEREPY